jgi:hypothetical protein
MFRVGARALPRLFCSDTWFCLVYARTDDERAVAEQLQQAVMRFKSSRATSSLRWKCKPAIRRCRCSLQQARRWNHIKQIASHPDWVPVVESGTADATLARSQYKRTVSVDDDIRKYLKAIHKSMKERGS